MQKAIQAISRELTPEQIYWKDRQYRDAIQPIIRMKTRIMCLVIPEITVYPDGRVEHDYKFTDDQKALLDNADKAINQIHRQIFGTGKQGNP